MNPKVRFDTTCKVAEKLFNGILEDDSDQALEHAWETLMELLSHVPDEVLAEHAEGPRPTLILLNGGKS